MQHVNHFLTLPIDMHAELSEIASRRGISFSDALMESIMNAIEEHRLRLYAREMQDLVSYDSARLAIT